MAKLKLKSLNERDSVNLFIFIETDFNQIVYTCVTNNKEWAIELFLNQFPSLDCGKKRLKDVLIYQCKTEGTDWHLIK